MHAQVNQVVRHVVTSSGTEIIIIYLYISIYSNKCGKKVYYAN